ncbi:MAG: hypothetical protein LUC99_06275 [Clostridiales bacterium]|nr:hypothetical protein [Clostridiales bacterium]
MKKKFAAVMVTAVATLAMSVPAFAGQWLSNANGWWWVNDDGSYPSNGWQWLDGNGDGVSECYYFDANGYCLINTTTPDGYMVDGSGAWIVNGSVQTQGGASTQTATEEIQAVVKDDSWVDLWKELNVEGNAHKRENLKTADELHEYETAWTYLSFDWGGDQYIVYENKGNYDYLTVTFAPGHNMGKTNIGTFLVKGENDVDENVKDWDELESINFTWDDDPQTVTVDVGDYDYVLIGCRHNDDSADMLTTEMYLHN